MIDPWLALAALAIEAVCGYPSWVDRRVPHPVRGVGFLIDRADRAWNVESWSEAQRKTMGIVTVIGLIGGMLVLGLLLNRALLSHWWLTPLWVAAASTGLAQRSLYEHVDAVRRNLDRGDLSDGRLAVGRIVGRDVDALDEGGISAAALESLAESFCDGVVAPAFWLALGGLAGLFVYKAVNTADSMIGHLEPRWRAFGWAAARVDDVVNLVPARLAGALLAAAGGGWAVMWCDAPKHASPNAGWPEAAMAGALHLRLGGPAAYDGAVHDRPFFGDGRAAQSRDIARGLRLYVSAGALMWILIALAGAAWRL